MLEEHDYTMNVMIVSWKLGSYARLFPKANISPV